MNTLSIAVVILGVLFLPIVLGMVYALVLRAGWDPLNVMAPEDYDEPE